MNVPKTVKKSTRDYGMRNRVRRAGQSVGLLLALAGLLAGAALPALPDTTRTTAAAAQAAPSTLNTWSGQGPWGGSVPSTPGRRTDSTAAPMAEQAGTSPDPVVPLSAWRR
jgi:hypothetical protein